MTSAFESLPSDLAAARAMIIAERAARVEAEAVAARAMAVNTSTEALIAHLKLEIEKLRRELYCSRSERKARVLEQMELQLEDLEAAATEDEHTSHVFVRHCKMKPRNYRMDGMKTGIQKIFAPFKVILPRWIWRPIRAVTTALVTPIIFSQWTGHFKSSLQEKAVSRKGEPLPWYTYPCIHFLLYRNYAARKVLEFGSGQSTLWWASRADKVVSCEGDKQWHQKLIQLIPANVDLRLVAVSSKEAFLADVQSILGEGAGTKYDIVIIDAEYREDLIGIALDVLSPDGAIICDDAESYGFYESTQGMSVERVDFFGHSPGVVLPHCTSIFFKGKCFLFDPRCKIVDVAIERY